MCLNATKASALGNRLENLHNFLRSTKCAKLVVHMAHMLNAHQTVCFPIKTKYIMRVGYKKLQSDYEEVHANFPMLHT